MPEVVKRDVVLAEGTFRILGTARGVRAEIRTHTALGPLALSVEIAPSPALRHAVWERIAAAHARMHALERGAAPMVTSGLFDDIGHAVSDVAQSATHAVVHTVEHAARGAAEGLFNAAKSAASQAVNQIGMFAHTLPAAIRAPVTAAARIIAQSHLGDIGAATFIRDTVNAAKRGVESARRAADMLLAGSKYVAKYLDLPSLAAEALHIPGLTQVVASLSPFKKYAQMVDALRKGDLKELGRMAKEQLAMVQGVISLVPGIGTGISAGISAAMAVLQGGGPLDLAIRTAYGALPIPPGLREVTDSVVDSVLTLVHGKSLTDAALVAARDRVPPGVPRDVFDTLVQVIVHHRPIVHAADDMIRHYVAQYAGPAAHVIAPHVLDQTAAQLGHYGSQAQSALGQVTQALHGAPANALPRLVPALPAPGATP
jgi:hypothetical protein